MKQSYLRTLVVFWVALVFLAGCSAGEEETVAKPDPVHFEAGDECHVCGMVIANFPGPKGQAITEEGQNVRKFCSTRDMFSWLLQPENARRGHTVYVHDMAQTEWVHPEDTALIDAREAFYVVGSRRSGAMGPTLASFASEAEAMNFSARYGGDVLAFQDITLDHLNTGITMGEMEDIPGANKGDETSEDHGH